MGITPVVDDALACNVAAAAISAVGSIRTIGGAAVVARVVSVGSKGSESKATDKAGGSRPTITPATMMVMTVVPSVRIIVPPVPCLCIRGRDAGSGQNERGRECLKL
jgi:hypothetical protein